MVSIYIILYTISINPFRVCCLFLYFFISLILSIDEYIISLLNVYIHQAYLLIYQEEGQIIKTNT